VPRPVHLRVTSTRQAAPVSKRPKRHRAVAVVRRGDTFLLMTRYKRAAKASSCRRCKERVKVSGERLRECPGHRYAVVPGGRVEAGETLAEAALRELAEEATLTGVIDAHLWTGPQRHDRQASYFLVVGVEGEPVLGGEEAAECAPDNDYGFVWAAPADFESLGLEPPVAAALLTGLAHVS
jgi:8-oxo-dGTP diphosphatase